MLIALLTVLTACGAANGAPPSPDDPVSGDDPTPTTQPMGEIPADAGPVYVNDTEILLLESFPVQVRLRVTGDLPTPCHEPVWEVTDDGETIAVTLASIPPPPDTACAEVLQPFEVSIDLGSYESASRVVTLNGEQVGELDI